VDELSTTWANPPADRLTTLRNPSCASAGVPPFTTSTATIQLDYATMRDGDRAGLALMRDLSVWIGIERDGGTTR
jgi:hypothetical protein